MFAAGSFHIYKFLKVLQLSLKSLIVLLQNHKNFEILKILDIIQVYIFIEEGTDKIWMLYSLCVWL